MVGTQGVQPHLGVVLRADRDALAVLQVDDLQRVIGDDDGVPRAEAFRYPGREIQSLFHQQHRVRCLLPGPGQLLHDDADIHVHVIQHVPGPLRAGQDEGHAPVLLVFFKQSFRQGMGLGPLRGIGAAAVREPGLQPCGGRAGQPAAAG